MRRPSKIVEYPWVVVRIECVLCTRKGIYRLARLAARYGPEQSLEGLLADLAQDCPYWRTNPRKYEPRCGARFVDLDRNLPPVDHPDAIVHRQRQPGREDVPKRRSTGPAVTGVVPTLSGWHDDVVRVSCTKCGRREAYAKPGLLAMFGDMRLTELRQLLVPGCPRWDKTDIYDLCGAAYVMPG